MSISSLTLAMRLVTKIGFNNITQSEFSRILVRLLNEQFDDIEQDTTNSDQANDHNKDITVFAGILL